MQIQTRAAAEGLCPLSDARSAFGQILDDITCRVVEQSGPPELWRLDISADCRFSDGAFGLAALAAIVNTRLPRIEVGSRGRPLQTVNFYAPEGGRIIAAVYDKGLESGVAPPGQLLRFEARSYRSGRRRQPLAQVDPRWMKDMFDSRFGALAESTHRLPAATPSEALRRIAEAVRSGEVDDTLARAAFTALCEEATGLAARWSPATASRRRRTLRHLGLSEFYTGVFDEHALAIGPLAADLLRAEVWGLGTSLDVGETVAK